MGNTYNISEVAKIFNITTNKIRFYEKKGLLEPTRDENNEYRVFSDTDILKLQSILLYRTIGMPIDNIKSIIQGTSCDCVNYVNNQLEIINNEIHRLTTIKKSLEGIVDEFCNLTKDEVLDVLKETNELNNLKNNWRDKWDFNNWAKSYDEDVVKDTGELKIYKNYDHILETVYNEATKFNIKNAKVLDIGVGTGNLASKFLGKGCEVTGIDQSKEMLSIAKIKFPNLKLRLGEFLKIPYSDKYFDIIVSTYAFHHLNEKEKVTSIEEMLRVLKENGVIVIGDLMFENENNKRNVLSKLSKAQVEEVEDEYYSNIDILNKEFKKHNKNLSYIKIDNFNYIIKIN